MEIHQVVVTAAPDDAVTNTAFEYQRLLRRVCPSEIYAAHRHPALVDDVHTLRDFTRRTDRSAGDVLVVHLSIGDVALRRFLDQRDERIVLVYHNVTPPEYFAPYDPAFARLLEDGRREVARLVDRAEVAIGVSRYNAAELEALGYRDVRVVPLVVDVVGFRSVAPDPVLLDLLTAVDGPTFLYVGQMLPHKRPDLLLEAYQVLVTKLVPDANLVLVGHARNRGFARAFREQLAELSLPRARFVGRATPAQLAACFESATAFVTASEHEGVCVPLLEAMAFDRPVVARDFGAVAETMGDAGLLLPAESGALLMAEALAELAASPDLRVDLVARGRRRLEDFDPDAARAAFLDVLLEVVQVRLLFVVSRYDAEHPDAAERRAQEFATRLAHRGHHVEVLTSGARRTADWSDDTGEGTTTEGGVVVHRLPVRAPRDERFFGPLQHRVLAAPGPVAHVVEREWMRVRGPDVRALPGRLASMAGDFDVVVFFSYLSATSFDGLRAVTGVVPTVFHPLVGDEAELRIGVLDEMFHAADAFAWSTEEEEALVRRRFAPTVPSTVIGTGVTLDDDARPDVAGFRARFGLGDRPYVVAADPLEPDGAAELIEMFAARGARRAEDAALVVLGGRVTGTTRSGTVIGTGSFDRATRTAAIAGCVALVEPSYRLTLSDALLEAWAHRRPALVQGRGDGLAGEARRSGGAIPYTGFAEFEAAVDLLVTTPGIVSSLGRAGREYVESRYRWDDVMDRYEWFLEDAMAHWRPPSASQRVPIG